MRALIAASGINIVDISGAEMLAREADRRRKIGGGLYFHFVKDAVRDFLERGGYLRRMGRESIFAPLENPIEKLYLQLDPGICRTCQARIFPQCHVALPDGEPRRDRPAKTPEPTGRLPV